MRQGYRTLVVFFSRRPVSMRRRAFLLSPAILDVLVLLTIGTLNVIAVLCWPVYAVSIITVSIATILLFIILR